MGMETTISVSLAFFTSCYTELTGLVSDIPHQCVNGSSMGLTAFVYARADDVHAHLDQFAGAGTDCTAPAKGCYGGYSRVKSVIDRKRPTHNDSLFLNLGDESQGTLYYAFYARCMMSSPGLLRR